MTALEKLEELSRLFRDTRSIAEEIGQDAIKAACEIGIDELTLILKSMRTGAPAAGR